MKTFAATSGMQGFGDYELFSAEGGRSFLCYRPPVPPMPALDEVWEALETARRAVDAFDHALRAFPVPGVVGSLFARLDAVHSSGAEGSTTTFTDLMEYQTWLRQAPDLHDADAVAGVAEAFDALQGALTDLPAAILAIHRRFLEKAADPYIAAKAGLWKSRPNAVMDPEAPTGMFHYTPPASLPAALDEWIAFTTANDGPELVRQALSHWMFEHIHPVDDGNGRVGRLLVPLLLKSKGATTSACTFLGEAVHENKTIYVEALKRGRRTGDMAAWTRVFLSLVAHTAGMNLSRLERLGQVHARWIIMTQGFRSHSMVHALVPWILSKPAFTIRDALAGIGRGTYASVNTGVKALLDLGIVQHGRSSARDRLFVAPEVIALFEAPAITNLRGSTAN